MEWGQKAASTEISFCFLHKLCKIYQFSLQADGRVISFQKLINGMKVHNITLELGLGSVLHHRN